jgi:hypothetical protein
MPPYTGGDTGAAPLVALAKVVAINGSHQSIPSGATTVVTGWTEQIDTANAFDPATGIFTAPADGFYMVTAAVLMNLVPQNANLFLGILVNGTAHYQGTFGSPATGGTTPTAAIPVSVPVQLTKNDTVKLGITQFSGVALTLFVTAIFNNLSIVQLP